MDNGQLFWAAVSPLTLPFTHAALQHLLRFRMWCHNCNLASLVSYWQHTGVLRHQSQLCGTDFADDMHLVFECAARADLHGQFPDIFQAHQTLQQFMWQSDLLQAAKCLDVGMNKLLTIGLDDE